MIETVFAGGLQALNGVAVRASSFMLASGGWSGFKTSLQNFFQNGLGGKNGGAAGIGIAILVIGIVAAVISFAMHHFNPQSRMPQWYICLVIGIAGALIMDGVGTSNTGLMGFLHKCAQWVRSVLGV